MNDHGFRVLPLPPVALDCPAKVILRKKFSCSQLHAVFESGARGFVIKQKGTNLLWAVKVKNLSGGDSNSDESDPD